MYENDKYLEDKIVYKRLNLVGEKEKSYVVKIEPKGAPAILTIADIENRDGEEKACSGFEMRR